MKTRRYFVIDNGSNRALVLRKKLSALLHGWTLDHQNPEYVFVLGGDGTSIQSAIRFRDQHVKLVVIKAGNFGFFAGFDEANLATLLNEIFISENYQTVSLLKVQYNNETMFGFNDVVLSSPFANKTNVYINKTFLEQCWNSGFIFATPLGSSGINKSANGPLVSPLVDCWIWSEINPITHASFGSLRNPFVLPKSAFITLKNESHTPGFSVIIDGIVQPDDFDKESLTINCVSSNVQLFFSWKLESYISKINKLFVKN